MSPSPRSPNTKSPSRSNAESERAQGGGFRGASDSRISALSEGGQPAHRVLLTETCVPVLSVITWDREFGVARLPGPWRLARRRGFATRVSWCRRSVAAPDYTGGSARSSSESHRRLLRQGLRDLRGATRPAMTRLRWLSRPGLWSRRDGSGIEAVRLLSRWRPRTGLRLSFPAVVSTTSVGGCEFDQSTQAEHERHETCDPHVQ